MKPKRNPPTVTGQPVVPLRESVPWKEVWEALERNNPHSTGTRDATAWLGPWIFKGCDWHEELIQPTDPRIDQGESANGLAPASKRDVKKYMKMKEMGTDFPPITLGFGVYSRGKFTVWDGAHRLQAAINLGVPVRAYVGTPIPSVEPSSPIFAGARGDPPAMTLRLSILDSHRDETFGRVEAWLDDGGVWTTDPAGKETQKGTRIGYTDFSEYEGEVWIKYVFTLPEYRRRGVAAAMYKRIQEEFPGEPIRSSGTTGEGGAFRKSLRERGIVGALDPGPFQDLVNKYGGLPQLLEAIGMDDERLDEEALWDDTERRYNYSWAGSKTRWEFPMTLYRMVRLEGGLASFRTQDAGVYWALSEKDAMDYWAFGLMGPDAESWVVKGRVNEEAMDRELTLLHDILYPEERQVVLKGGAPVQVLAVKKSGDKRWAKPPWKTITASVGKTAKAVDYALIARILEDLMKDVESNLPTPQIKVFDRARSMTDGACAWTPGTPNTTIKLSKAVCFDEPSLRRIIAHELCHHEQYLVHWSNWPPQQAKFMGKLEGGHGKTFRAIADRWNAKYGKDFVTVTSDQNTKYEYEDKPFFVFITRLYSGLPMWQASIRLTDKQRTYMSRKNMEETRLVMTTDRELIHAPVIGSGKGWKTVPRGNHGLSVMVETLMGMPDLRAKWPTPPPATKAIEEEEKQQVREAFIRYQEQQRWSEQHRKENREAFERDKANRGPHGERLASLRKTAFIREDLIMLKNYLTMDEKDRGMELARDHPDDFVEFLENEDFQPPAMTVKTVKHDYPESPGDYNPKDKHPFGFVPLTLPSGQPGFGIKNWMDQVLSTGKTKQQAYKAWADGIMKTYQETDAERAQRASDPNGFFETMREGDDENVWDMVPDEYYDRFGKEKSDTLSTDYAAEAPSWAHMSFEKIVKNQWLVHMTDDPDGVADSGFTHGMYDLTHLGLTTWYTDKAKEMGGYNFAFPANNVPNDATKYGKNAVMFTASGVQVYHYGDEEDQVIFWGRDARNIIPIYFDHNDYRWNLPGGDNGNPIFSSEKLDDVIDWVSKNFTQYHRLLVRNPQSHIERPLKRRRAAAEPSEGQIIEKAIKQWGVQETLDDAGFILPDGRVIDLKGKEHPDFAARMKTPVYVFERKARSLAVRKAYGTLYLRLQQGVWPTSQQFSKLFEVAQQVESVNVDFFRGTEGAIASQRAEVFTEPEMVELLKMVVEEGEGRLQITAGSHRNTAFDEWFYGSKVVDAKGNPLVVYHGTAIGTPIDKFQGEVYPGWFAEDPKLAEMYSRYEEEEIDSTVYPVYLRIRNPLDLTSCDLNWAGDVEDLVNAVNRKQPGFTTLDEVDELFPGIVNTEMWEFVDSRGFRDWIKPLGCDGLKAKENGKTVWVVFNSNQVKSAIGNKGTFDLRNPSITADSHKQTPHRENEFPDLDEGEAVGGYGTQPEAIEDNRTGLDLGQLGEQAKMAASGHIYSKADVARHVSDTWHDSATFQPSAKSFMGMLDSDQYELRRVNVKEIMGASWGCYDNELARRYSKMETDFPPIVLSNDPSEGYVFDGHHRLTAALCRGDKEIWAFVPVDWEGVKQRTGDASRQTASAVSDLEFVETDITAEESSYENTSSPGVAILARSDYRNVGALEMYFSNGNAYVRGIVVAPHYQHLGVGQDLYDRAISLAKDRGLKYFYSDQANSMSGDAQKAWSRLKNRYKVEFEPSEDGYDSTGRKRIDLKTAAALPWLYHVTYFNRLEDIVWLGLEPDHPASIGELHSWHTKGRSFLTEWRGVSFWYQRAIQWAYHNSDHPVEDGLTPVVLRTKEYKRLKTQEDIIGTGDAGAEAAYTEKTIPAKRLEVWNGHQWTRLTEDAISAMTPEGYSQSFGGGDDWPEVGSATMDRYIDESILYPKMAGAVDKLLSWEQFLKKEGGIAKIVNGMGTNWDRFEPYWDMEEYNQLSDSEQDKVMQQNAYRELGERYNDLLDQHMSWSLPLTVYRVLTLQDIKDIKTKGIGVYWSWDEDAAEAHWGHFGQGFQNYTLKAQVQEKDVDWTGTMWANLDPDLGEDEKEIRLKSGARPLLLAWKRGNEEWQLPLRQWRSITVSKEVE
jgi:GNAT superfamily N-acetyltransferase